MTIINQSQYDTPKTNYFSTIDTSFVSGDSPVTFNINSTLLRNGIDGHIINDGLGNIQVNISEDGNTFLNDIILKKNEIFNLRALSIHSIKFTWIADSAYRLFVV